MFKLKFSSFISIVIFSFLSAKCEFMCDVYVEIDKARLIFTIEGYKIPPKNYTQINVSVPCPCSASRPCLRKCCLRDDVYTASTNRCNSFNKASANFENLPNILIGDYQLIYGSLCSKVEKSLETFQVLQDGSLKLQHDNLPLHKYCIDYFKDKEGFWLLECKEPIPETRPWERKKIVFMCLGLSVVSLIVTFLVYSCNRELRNVPGKVLLCYVSSILTTELCLLGMQFISVSHGLVCEIAAHVFQFSFSATFFWMNVMCFDVWSTFRRLTIRNHEERRNNKFYLYCLYAWGMPLIISSVIMLIDQSIIPGNFVKPEIGQNSCWFKTHEAKFWYFYSYTSILLVLNLYMFSITLLNLLNKTKKMGKILKSDESRRFNAREKHRFYLYLKLFLIMGINWPIDALSYYMRDFKNLNYVWIFTNYMNVLQGFFIFLIFVCNRKVLLLLNRKFSRSRINSRSNEKSGTNNIIIRGCGGL